MSTSKILPFIENSRNILGIHIIILRNRICVFHVDTFSVDPFCVADRRNQVFFLAICMIMKYTVLKRKDKHCRRCPKINMDFTYNYIEKPFEKNKEFAFCFHSSKCGINSYILQEFPE